MTIKTDLAIGAVLVGALIIFKDKIGGALSSAGLSLGQSVSMGFEGFFSGLGSAFGLGGTPGQMMQSGGGGMMQSSGGGMDMMKMIVGNVDTTGGTGLDQFLKDFQDLFKSSSGGKPFDVGGGGLTGGVGQTSNSIFNFLEMLTGKIRGSSADATLTTSSLNDIFKGAYDFLAKGGMSIDAFLKSYKFPSGNTLEEILGGGVKPFPEAAGQTPTPEQLMQMNLLMDYNLKQKQVQQQEKMLVMDYPTLFRDTGFAGGLMGEKTLDTPYVDLSTGTQIGQFTRNTNRENIVIQGEAMRSLQEAMLLYGSGAFESQGFKYFDPHTMMYI